MPTILVVNGPNLNLLGQREPDVYGATSLDELNQKLTELATDLGVELKFYQSNSEGEIIDFIQKQASGATGMIINPGALTHYSHAIRDTITAVGIDTVEVHLSNIYAREQFRQHSVTAPACRGVVSGFGLYSYAMALAYFADSGEEG